MTTPFESVTEADMLAFAAQYPLAWVVPVAMPSAAILMPVLVESEQGQPTALLGHLPRRSEANAAFQQDTAAVVLFLGPNAYIPPGWLSQPHWAPTWNFVSLKVEAEISPSPDLARPAIEQLAQHMEKGQETPWNTAELGGRYETLLQHVTGFRAPITALHPRFKTGQDETARSWAEIRAALGDHPLAQWMSEPGAR